MTFVGVPSSTFIKLFLFYGIPAKKSIVGGIKLSIIKTIKSTEYLQLHNKPAQTLTDLRSIGLLTHLMSLPETWIVRKTYLYRKFGRAAVSHAFNELEKNGYLVSIKYRVGNRNNYTYLVSDIPITKEQIESSIKDIEFPILEVSGADFKHLKKSNFSGVDFEHLKLSSSNSTAQKEHLLNKTNKNKILTNKIDNKEIFVNKDVNNFKITALSIFEKHYQEFAPGRWSKDSYLTIANKFIEEHNHDYESIKNIEGYIYGALKQMAYHVDYRNGKISPRSYQNTDIPFYDWLSKLN